MRKTILILNMLIFTIHAHSLILMTFILENKKKLRKKNNFTIPLFLILRKIFVIREIIEFTIFGRIFSQSFYIYIIREKKIKKLFFIY